MSLVALHVLISETFLGGGGGGGGGGGEGEGV